MTDKAGNAERADAEENHGVNEEKRCNLRDEDYTVSRIRDAFPMLSDGAGSRGRTDTVLPPPDFESGTSANSIIPANIRFFV